MKHQLTVRLEDEMYNHLKMLSEKEERAMSYFIVKALDSFLDNKVGQRGLFEDNEKGDS